VTALLLQPEWKRRGPLMASQCGLFILLCYSIFHPQSICKTGWMEGRKKKGRERVVEKAKDFKLKYKGI
jgi:hypothetical protein